MPWEQVALIGCELFRLLTVSMDPSGRFLACDAAPVESTDLSTEDKVAIEGNPNRCRVVVEHRPHRVPIAERVRIPQPGKVKAAGQRRPGTGDRGTGACGSLG